MNVNIRFGSEIHFTFQIPERGSVLILNNWMNLFNIGKRLNLFNMFNRRNNRGILWVTLIGLGVSVATVFGFRRNGNRNKLAPIQNFTNNGRINRMATAVTEFSKELMPNQNQK